MFQCKSVKRIEIGQGRQWYVAVGKTMKLNAYQSRDYLLLGLNKLTIREFDGTRHMIISQDISILLIK